MPEGNDSSITVAWAIVLGLLTLVVICWVLSVVGECFGWRREP